MTNIKKIKYIAREQQYKKHVSCNKNDQVSNIVKVIAIVLGILYLYKKNVKHS